MQIRSTSEELKQESSTPVTLTSSFADLNDRLFAVTPLSQIPRQTTFQGSKTEGTKSSSSQVTTQEIRQITDEANLDREVEEHFGHMQMQRVRLEH